MHTGQYSVYTSQYNAYKNKCRQIKSRNKYMHNTTNTCKNCLRDPYVSINTDLNIRFILRKCL